MRSAAHRRLSAAAFALAALGLHAAAARADECSPGGTRSTCIDADNLWPHAGGGPFFALGSTTTTPRGQVAFGLVTSYLSRPIALRVASADPNGATVYPIDNAVDVTLLWALGVTDRLEITVAAPATLYQGPGTLEPIGAENLPRSVIRDLRFGATLALLRRSRMGDPSHPPTPALTSRLEFAAPTATRGALAGASTMTLIPSLVFDYRVWRFDVAAEASARLRGESRLADAVWGPQVGGAIGVSFDAIPERWLTVAGEAFALYTVAKQEGSSPALAPAEWIASVSTARLLGGDLVLSLGGGGPIPFGHAAPITEPRFRFNLGIKYAPTGADRDADGVLDRDDKCPDSPEDRDGFQDADGCPDPDNDGDKIPDDRDRCRDQPEDFDGFQDADGCPDTDDDHDGVPDTDDKCRNEAEDRDGFQDADGCPDPDNDGDKIPDDRDRCPNAAEDFDGYQDEDGCPDPDNDGDRISDAQDQCPDAPEDFDGFQDADGCPDPDNDEDGVLDRLDRCPNEAETINGVDDEDGCPEPGAKSLVRWAGDRIVLEGALRFPAAKAAPSKDLEKQLVMMATLARSRSPLGAVVIEAYADRPGDASVRALEIASARAEAVKKVFVAAGIPEAVITAVPGDPAAKRGPGAPAIEVTARRASRSSARGKRAAPPANEKKPE